MIGECLDFVGDITVPLSLLVVGSLLAGLPAKQVFSSPRLWILSALRLLALPAWQSRGESSGRQLFDRGHAAQLP